MTAAHTLYIPAILLIGFVLGMVIGARRAREELLEEQRRAREREERRERLRAEGG